MFVSASEDDDDELFYDEWNDWIVPETKYVKVLNLIVKVNLNTNPNIILLQQK